MSYNTNNNLERVSRLFEFFSSIFKLCLITLVVSHTKSIELLGNVKLICVEALFISFLWLSYAFKPSNEINSIDKNIAFEILEIIVAYFILHFYFRINDGDLIKELFLILIYSGVPYLLKLFILKFRNSESPQYQLFSAGTIILVAVLFLNIDIIRNIIRQLNTEIKLIITIFIIFFIIPMLDIILKKFWDYIGMDDKFD